MVLIDTGASEKGTECLLKSRDSLHNQLWYQTRFVSTTAAQTVVHAYMTILTKQLNMENLRMLQKSL